ncbi:SMI1/KNR4 family protein [Xanthomonas oryzae]|uniref:SMI1/KNR4 family protein n=1 Tax=Xanthomonas oryzae TaxID=347 RepID=UPI001033110A|nr:SMI1/KNR4 family protein [Xanthomonas oryzae]QBG87412.1 hypothetical protein EYC54_06170 [Xanthomonas oryzae]QBH00769.1 hypothetical protein EYC56_17630 [Xanthomonas oryzae]QBH03026.1 hypothetical protein EYC57_05755 [Xanthomonas oryzae]
MTINSELDRLGGVLPLGAESFTPVQRSEIQKISVEFHVEFAEDYVDFIEKYGCCSLGKEVFLRFERLDAVYIHDSDLCIPNYRREGCGLSHFYGVRIPLDTLNIEWALSTYRGRMPRGSLPIADDGVGGQICYISDPLGKAGFYWWDHNNEWDEDDYLDETGQEMPEAAKYQNLYFIAENFEGFLKRAEVLPGI